MRFLRHALLLAYYALHCFAFQEVFGFALLSLWIPLLCMALLRCAFLCFALHSDRDKIFWCFLFRIKRGNENDREIIPDSLESSRTLRFLQEKI